MNTMQKESWFWNSSSRSIFLQIFYIYYLHQIDSVKFIYLIATNKLIFPPCTFEIYINSTSRSTTVASNELSGNLIVAFSLPGRRSRFRGFRLDEETRLLGGCRPLVRYLDNMCHRLITFEATLQQRGSWWIARTAGGQRGRWILKVAVAL